MLTVAWLSTHSSTLPHLGRPRPHACPQFSGRDILIDDVERYLIDTAKVENLQAYYHLQTFVGVGKIPGLVLLYEIHDIRRFADVGQFLSYARLGEQF
jgi:hypothetical protein